MDSDGADGGSGGLAESRRRLAEMDSRRREMETELALIVERLNEMPGSPGISGTLIDDEGFPRSDIDIHSVRRERNRRAVLQTDHEQLMKEIETELAGFHALAREIGEINLNQENGIHSNGFNGNGMVLETHENEHDEDEMVIEEQHLNTDSLLSATPLAIIDAVSPDSPAATGGLMTGDRIIKFGAASSLIAGHSLATIASATLTSEGTEMTVIVKRESDLHHLSVTPSRSWGGRGLLGCHLIPFRS